MNRREDAYEALQSMLTLTRDEELDCEHFVGLLASYVERRVDDPRLVALIEHHRELCAECAEELAILQRALQGD